MDLRTAVVVGGTVLAAVLAVRARQVLIVAGPPVLLARGFLLLSVWVWAVPLVPLVLLASVDCPPLLLLLPAALLFYLCRNRVGEVLWSHGIARWASVEDLAWAGMIHRTDGLLLGRVTAPSLGAALRLLCRAPLVLSGTVCRVFLAAVRRQPLWVTASRGVHTVAVAPAGKGKSTGLVIPYLLSCPDPMVVIDVKGELALATAEYRRQVFGQKVVILDPYQQATPEPDTFNPLDLIDPKDPHALDDIRALAEAIVVRTGEEKEPHWNDGAEMYVAGISALVAGFAPAERNLQTVAQILASPEDLARARIAMRASTAWGGLLARMGEQLAHFEGKELGSTLTTVARHLRFLSTPACVASTRSSSFEPHELTTGMTVYLVIPPDKLATQNGLLRLWVSSFLRHVTRTGLKHDRRIRFVLDEAAALGRMEVIENAITQLRGYGLAMLFFYQSMGQLRKVYTEGQDQTFLANMDVQVFFGVNDMHTAEYVSQRLGEATLRLVSESGGTTRTRNYDPHGMESTSVTRNTGWGTQEVGRALLKKEEVCQLDEQQAVIFAPGVPPVTVWLTRCFEPAFLTRPGRVADSLRRLVASCLGLALTSVVLAVWMAITLAARWEERGRQTLPPPPTIPGQPFPQPQLPWAPQGWKGQGP